MKILIKKIWSKHYFIIIIFSQLLKFFDKYLTSDNKGIEFINHKSKIKCQWYFIKSIDFIDFMNDKSSKYLPVLIWLDLNREEATH